MRLKGKTVFITGGTGGIGRPLVRFLAAEGAHITAYSHQQQGDLVSHLDTLSHLLADNPPDILINMAGLVEFDYCESQNADSLIALNLLTPIKLIQAVLPGMKKRNTGQIINIGSMIGFIPLPHMSVYAASKAGLKGFSDSLRRELAGTNIKVTHISPRAVSTTANSGLMGALNQQTKTHQDQPDDVAQHILEAIIACKADVRIGWPERFFAAMNALLPAVVDNGLGRNRLIAEQLLSTNTKQKDNHHEILHHASRRSAS